MRHIALVVWLLLATGSSPALAQAVACNWPGSPPGAPLEPLQLPTVAEFLNVSAPMLRVDGRVRQRATAEATVTLTVVRPEGMAEDAWRYGWFEAVLVARPQDPVRPAARADDLRLGQVAPPSTDGRRTTLTVRFPGVETGIWPPARDIAVLFCPARTDGGVREVATHARQPVPGLGQQMSALVGVLVVLLLYGLLALAAIQVQRPQFQALRARDGGAPSALAYALRPPVIAQDSFGAASLARFQILLFTLTLAGVYAYVFARTEELPDISNSVLALLGITLTGSALARATERSSVEGGNRLWLLGTGVLDSTIRIPCWSDLIASDGEIDASRVQALVFSIFAAVALVVSGTADLSSFTIPEQLNYLIGISQGAYVAGRALPRESARRLNDEVRAIRDAEMKTLADPTDTTALKAFETARNGLGTSLLDVFGERFRAERLARLQPGERTAPPLPSVPERDPLG